MKTSTALVISILATATACKPSDDFDLKGFSADGEDRMSAQTAADQWCSASHGEFCAHLSGGENTIQLVDAIDRGVQSQTSRSRGKCSIDTILVADQFPDPTLRELLLFRAVRRELGHHFSSDVSGMLPEGNAMFGSLDYGQPDQLTEADLAFARR
jgi:hypothetical protein